MKKYQVLQNDPLWKRLQNFSLDDHGGSFPFSKKLAKEENWTAEFTGKAIEEYKKFVYLCCLMPEGASPSETVDRVWHMHLLYTRNYWEMFCPEILRQKLHHHPSKGGIAENKRHKKWFQDTVDTYRQIFRHEPPDDIWSVSKKRETEAKKRRTFIRLVSLLLLLFILSSCSDHAGALQQIIFIALPLIFFFSVMFRNRNNDDDHHNNKGDSGFGGSCSSGSSCNSSCGSSCGGCGGCGGD